jgi:MFS family permease
VVEEYR